MEGGGTKGQSGMRVGAHGRRGLTDGVREQCGHTTRRGPARGGIKAARLWAYQFMRRPVLVIVHYITVYEKTGFVIVGT